MPCMHARMHSVLDLGWDLRWGGRLVQHRHSKLQAASEPDSRLAGVQLMPVACIMLCLAGVHAVAVWESQQALQGCCGMLLVAVCCIQPCSAVGGVPSPVH